MAWKSQIPEGSQPLGYRALIEILELQTLPHDRWSYVTPQWARREIHCENENLTLYLYPASYKPSSDEPISHLEFALKHEGMNLGILQAALKKLSPQELITYISCNPTGKYARILWYLYEKFCSRELPLPNVQRGSYVSLLDPHDYYCAASQKSPRHRINDNLLGSTDFCPIIRKTSALKKWEEQHLEQAVTRLTHHYNEALLLRAMHYLYTKETLASWEIECEKPDQRRLLKFISLLEQTEAITPLNKQKLIQLQKEIVDPRFALEDYRTFQNYIGEEPTPDNLILHYISPKPEDVERLMNGLLTCFTRLLEANLPPVIIATVLSFGFVFIHPFWDGNGRLHRFLMHYTLSHCQFVPPGLIFPVSAAILRHPRRYDKALESFSRPLLELINNYSIDEAGKMHIFQETLPWYQYLDLTVAAEFLFECVEETMTVDFPQELQFLQTYDRIKQQLKSIVEMPDQQIDLFIRCVRQNRGKLSSRKREKYFAMLTDREVAQMEGAIQHTLA